MASTKLKVYVCYCCVKEEAREAAKAANVDIIGGMELVKKVGGGAIHYVISYPNRLWITKLILIFACVPVNCTLKCSHCRES